MRTGAITINRMAGALGAEIAGVDLSQDLDNATTEAIHVAFLEHRALVLL